MKKNISKNQKIIIAIIILGIIIFITTLVISKNNLKPNQTNVQKDIPKDNFICSNEELHSYPATVTGILKNDTDNIYKNVSVSYLLYDEEGNNIGELFDSFEFLGAYDTWNFEATSQNTDTRPYQAHSFSIKEINGTKLENDINITNDFEISNIEWGKGNKYTSPANSNYEGIYIESSIKNISATDYNEPFTIIYSIYLKSTGNKVCSYYHTINSLKAQSTTKSITQEPYDAYAYVPIKYSSSKGLYFDSIYKVSVACIIKGKLID